MATNPYNYGTLGTRWTVGEPTSKSLLDISRVKNDANRWTLEQLITDPDDSATLGFGLSFASSEQRLLQIHNTDISKYFQIYGGRAGSPTSDHLVFSTGTNGTIMEFDGANHWITFHNTAGVQKMYYRGDGSPGLILESGVVLTVGGLITASAGISGTTGTFSGDVAVGTDKLFVDVSASRVGIGTTAPSHTLDVNGSMQIERNGSSPLLRFTDTSSSSRWIGIPDGSSRFAIYGTNGSTEELVLDSSGRVGIGTSSPVSTLNVAGTFTLTGAGQQMDNGQGITAKNASGTYRQLMVMDGSNNLGLGGTVDGGIIFYTSLGNERARITSTGAIEIPNQNAINELTFTGTDYTNIFSQTTNGMQFGSVGAGSYLSLFASNAVAIHIDSSQRVGIGTTSPSALLHLYKSGSTQAGLIETDQSASVFNFKSTGQTAGQPQIGCSGSNLILNTNGAERMRILGDGRIGIGTISPDANTDIHIVNNAVAQIRLTTGTSANTYLTFGDSADVDAGRIVYANATDSMLFYTTGSAAMTIDSSQRVGIGTITPTSGYSLDIANSSSANVYIRTTASSDTANSLAIEGYRSNGSAGYLSRIEAKNRNGSVAITQIDSETESVYNSGALVFKTASTGTMAERARIDSSGRFFIGTTTAGLTNTNGFGFNNLDGISGSYLNIGHIPGSASGLEYIGFSYNGGQIGSIRQSGTTAVTYNTTSDYRLKENVVGITDGITRIKSLKPSRFNFIAEADRTVDGFLAHEVSDVVPEAISGAKDAVDDEGNPQYQGIDQSKLVPLLTAALQEAIAKIETLETKVAALEAA